MMMALPRCGLWTALASTWLISMVPQASWAQLSISVDDDVRIQDGNKPALVVKPGQSFGGRLTANGFEGVMNGQPHAVVAKSQPMTSNPFRDADATIAKPLTIQAGGLSVTVPMSAAADMRSARTAMPEQKREALRQLVRTRAAAAMPQLERMMAMYAQDPELLQLKALMHLQMGKHREAAAFAYDAMAMDADACWDWPKLRASLADREAAAMMSRMLQQRLREHPSMEMEFLTAWWEQMLGHHPESMALMTRLMQSRPHDPVFSKLLADWKAAAAETPPATQP